MERDQITGKRDIHREFTDTGTGTSEGTPSHILHNHKLRGQER